MTHYTGCATASDRDIEQSSLLVQQPSSVYSPKARDDALFGGRNEYDLAAEAFGAMHGQDTDSTLLRLSGDWRFSESLCDRVEHLSLVHVVLGG